MTPLPPAGYTHALAIPTRWADNDIYGHVNNVEYYAFFDTVINEYLIRAGGLDIHAGETIGVCAESHCRYLAAVAFPQIVTAGLRVGKLGHRSVRYEIALEREGERLAEGWFVHVFVDRATRKAVEIPAGIRVALQSLLVDQEESP
jgi:acyl-CoA thioester hydrolase